MSGVSGDKTDMNDKRFDVIIETTNNEKIINEENRRTDWGKELIFPLKTNIMGDCTLIGSECIKHFNINPELKPIELNGCCQINGA